MINQSVRVLAIAALVFVGSLHAQIPNLINYQGRVAVGAPPVNFDGPGQFKFALVNATGTTTYWSNDGTSTAGSQPTGAVSLTVTKGLYSLLLGDTALANMTAVPTSVFTNADVRLRVWFNDGTNGWQLLTPDQRIASVGYAYNANAAQTAQTATTAGSFSGALAGDVTGTQGSTVVATVGGVTAANVAAGANLANAATNTNTASTIVKRDASGNFAAGTITGNLNGNATTASAASSVAAANITGAITNAQLASPVVTINTGSGLTGGGTVALGGTLTLQATGGSGVTSLTGGGGITVSGATGAVTLGSNATSSNAASTLVMRDANGDLSAGSITANQLALPASTSPLQGVLTIGGTAFLHNFGPFPNNVFVGPGAGNFTTTGQLNIGVGGSVLDANTTGDANSALGSGALGANTTGADNTGIGRGALSSNVSGVNNTAVGSFALRYSTANSNTAVGYTAMMNTTTGGANTAVGIGALSPLSGVNTGSGNTALGASALRDNTTGISNIAIGQGAGLLLTTGNNNIAIGNQGVAAESTTIRIGTSGTHTRAFIAGIRGITTGSATGINVLIDTNGQLGTVSSSRRYKEDIADMGDASERLLALRPVTFRYKKGSDDGAKPIQFGLIAEEVAEAFPELAVFNEDGQPETVKYQDLPPLLLNEFLKQHKEVGAQRAVIEEQRAMIAAQREELTRLADRLAAVESTVRRVSERTERRKPSTTVALRRK